MSQEELAIELDISQTKLSNIESGTTKAVDFELVNKVRNLFEVSFEYFTETRQSHKKKHNQGKVAGNNYGTINNHPTPEALLKQVKALIGESLSKLERELRQNRN
ncbi:helix-turn-helix transcriptional regulator [Sinomicrobium sp. FJxs]|uniref:Helix-turn-helix transcriptional regulator n=2 Tax=Sinomicrobium weinanense TaxID=2842200 RepID=A0A926JV24_9FLAO|nr:helix-turn-helix transcriptional regulator [Sinomicrobium weinanense]MBU3122546.1 helix-turn-helix domain-containing protein [Sinomicrobium weinanense]